MQEWQKSVSKIKCFRFSFIWRGSKSERIENVILINLQLYLITSREERKDCSLKGKNSKVHVINIFLPHFSSQFGRKVSWWAQVENSTCPLFHPPSFPHTKQGKAPIFHPLVLHFPSLFLFKQNKEKVATHITTYDKIFSNDDYLMSCDFFPSPPVTDHKPHGKQVH